MSALEYKVKLRSVQSDADGLPSTVEFDAGSGRRAISVAALFVAQHVVPMTDVIRGGATDVASFLPEWHLE